MKALIEREVSRRDLDHHLKLGTGGIREIEFIVQSMQLVRGGSDRRLQKAALLQVLPLLAGSKLVSPDDIAELTEAYLELRKAENALQMMRDQQTHTLPEDPQDRARLTLIMGFKSWDETLAALNATLEKVAAQFEALLFGTPDAQRRHAEIGVAWLDSADAKIEEELANGGFPRGEIAAVAGILESFRQAANYRRLDEAGHRRLYVILARLLKAAAAHASPATVVQRVLRVLEAIGSRSSYLALLKEQPAALDRLIEVCAISGFLSRQIADFPLLLDELIDAKAFDELPTRAGFTLELAARTERLSARRPGTAGRGVAAISKGGRFHSGAGGFDRAFAADARQRSPYRYRRTHRRMLHGPCLATNDTNATARRIAETIREVCARCRRRRGIRQARRFGAGLCVGPRFGVSARFGRQHPADRGRQAARQRHILLAIRTAHRAPADHAFRCRPPL